MRVCLIVVASLLSASAWAQSATVSFFNAAATDPNVSKPLSTAVYSTPTCNLSKASEMPPIVNPVEGRYDDPANVTRDCAVNLSSQVSALPAASGYRGAVKLGTGLFGPFSTAFAVAAQTAHPCDATPTSPTTITVGVSFTLGWCHSGTDSSGTAPVTSWRLYRNNTLLTGVTVTAGATANAAGLRLYTATRTEAAPVNTLTYEVSAVNSVGEGARHPFPVFASVAAASVPGAASRGRIAVP